MITVILKGQKLLSFCKELNIKSNTNTILIRINGNKAEYYNPEKECYCKLDIEIAKKYI